MGHTWGRGKGRTSTLGQFGRGKIGERREEAMNISISELADTVNRECEEFRYFWAAGDHQGDVGSVEDSGEHEPSE